MKLMVYTVITNNYDILNQQYNTDDTVDYYCYTDDPNLKSDFWNVIYTPNEEGIDSVRYSRKLKILGNKEIEKKYDYVMYVDANIVWQKSIKDFFNLYFTGKNEMLFLKHNDRDCTYDEANMCIEMDKDSELIIKDQINFLEKEKFPKHYGLVCANLFIRKTKSKKVEEFLNQWYLMISKYSRRDQLSIMYSLWKNDSDYDFIDFDSWNNSYFFVAEHNCYKNEKAFGNAYNSKLALKEKLNKYETEGYTCGIEDLNDSHSIIARKVKANSTVLDIGCAYGLMGKLLKDNRNCVIDGIEVDEESAKIAKQSNKYRDVYHFSISECENKNYKSFFNKKIKYDYIILADVLEHLEKPWEILLKLNDCLNDNGKILVSVPNVSYFDVIKGIMSDRFNYNQVGILDCTHLRFFTKKSFVEMIKNINYSYDTYYSIEFIESTFVEFNDIEEEMKDVLLKNDFCLQNIYEITKESKRENIRYKLIDNEKSLYNRVNEKMTSHSKIIDLQENEIKKLKENISSYKAKENENLKKIEELSNGKQLCEQQLLNIYSSKGWKALEKMRKAKNKVLGGSKK